MADNKNNLPPPPPPPPPPSFGPGNDPSQRPSPARVLVTWLCVLAMLAIAFYSFSRDPLAKTDTQNNLTFQKLVEENKVEKVVIVRQGNGKTYLNVTEKGDDSSDGKIADTKRPFKLYVSPNTEEIEKYLRANNIPVTVDYPSTVMGDLMIQVIPVVLLLLLLYFIFFRQMKNSGIGAMSMGKSRAKRLGADKRKVTFADVAGIEQAKEEVQEIVEFLKAPKKFAKLGARIPKGVLLMGPPGTGKTLLAKAIAGEADVPFFSISGSDFVEMFVGLGASRVRDMFEQGKKNAPCIIFIDEIDAVGRSRFTGIGGGHDEREQTLNAMLVEMDGFETSDGVIVIAATNRPDVLDKALLRPGRFDRQIVIDLPTLEGRQKILEIHAKKIKLAPEVKLDRIARGTPGFSGADLANLMNEAALLAARENKEAVDLADLEEARDKACWGRERPDRMKDEEEKRLTAIHESGHAIVMALSKNGEPIHKVTIIPRGMALGATMFLPKKDRVQFTRSQMEAQLATSMGGRVAEALFIGDISSGAQQDLRQATDLAHRMVCDWGMSDALGPRTFGAREEMMFLGREVGRTQDYSEATAQKIDAEVDKIVRKAYETAKVILTENSDKLNTLVDRLLEKETVPGEEVYEIVEHGHVLSEEERKALHPELDEEKEESASASGEPAPDASPDADAPAAKPDESSDAPAASADEGKEDKER